MLAFVRTVLLIAFSMSLFGAFGPMVFSNHLLPQWVGGVAGAVVGTGLALASEGLPAVSRSRLITSLGCSIPVLSPSPPAGFVPPASSHQYCHLHGETMRPQV